MAADDNKKIDSMTAPDQPERRIELAAPKKPERTIYHINPQGLRVVVRIPPEHNMSEGGLYLPEGAKESMVESILCEVVEVASAVDNDTDDETNVSGIPLGALVLIPKRSGTKVPWDEQLRIVETKEVLAVVSRIDLS